MPTVSITTDIAAPPPDVYAVVADFEQGPRWQANMSTARWTSTPPHDVGSTFEQTAGFMGRELKQAYEVIEFDPPRAVAIRITSGPFPVTVRRVLEPHDGGTRITETTSGGPGGIRKLLAPLMTAMVRRTITRDYRKLKDLLEQPGA